MPEIKLSSSCLRLFLWLVLAPAITGFGAPLITEFMAANDSTLADEDGEFSDWIEIHNPDSTPISLAGYHLLPSVRGDLLAKLGRFDEARAELTRAAELTQNARERGLLRKKLEAL